MVNPKKKTNALEPLLLEVYHWSSHHWIFYPHKHAWWNPGACPHCWQQNANQNNAVCNWHELTNKCLPAIRKRMTLWVPFFKIDFFCTLQTLDMMKNHIRKCNMRLKISRASFITKTHPHLISTFLKWTNFLCSKFGHWNWFYPMCKFSARN